MTLPMGSVSANALFSGAAIPLSGRAAGGASRVADHWRFGPTPPLAERVPYASEHSPVAVRRFELKEALAEIAMYLAADWRSGLFRQIDSLLDEDEWQPADKLPSLASFQTFRRMIMMLGRPRRPGLGCTDRGDIIATWYVGPDRLTIECRTKDEVRWALSRARPEGIDTAAGTSKITRLRAILAAYEPEVWFGPAQTHSG